MASLEAWWTAHIINSYNELTSNGCSKLVLAMQQTLAAWTGRPSDENRDAADSHAGNPILVAVDRDVHAARSSHCHALQAEHAARHVGRHEPVMQQVRTEWTAGGARGRIFRNPKAGGQHPTVDSFVAAAATLGCKEEGRQVGQTRRMGAACQRLPVDRHGVDRSASGERREEKRNAARHALHGQARKTVVR